jgi:hypothetical protein
VHDDRTTSGGIPKLRRGQLGLDPSDLTCAIVVTAAESFCSAMHRSSECTGVNLDGAWAPGVKIDRQAPKGTPEWLALGPGAGRVGHGVSRAPRCQSSSHHDGSSRHPRRAHPAAPRTRVARVRTYASQVESTKSCSFHPETMTKSSRRRP